MRRSFCVSIAMALLAVAASYGAAPVRVARGPTTFFVSPEGRDTGPGNDKYPWRTIQRGVAAAKPGDTIVVRPGLYAGFILGWDEAQRGTAEAPITFQAQKGVTITTPNG